MPDFSFLEDDQADDGGVRINTSRGRRPVPAKAKPAKPGAAYETFSRIASFVLFVAMIGGCMNCMSLKPQTEEEFNTADNSALAMMKAQRHIKHMLKAPASAKWPGMFEDPSQHATKLADGTYMIHSYVDAQNGFGALVRTRYQVHLRLHKDGHADILAARLLE